MRSIQLGVVLLAGVMLVGCQAQDKLYDVSGTVLHQGKPIPKGLIFFDPDPVAGTKGAQGQAEIKDGKFNTAESGRGVRGGAYILRVSGFDGKPLNESPFGRALFPEYQENRDLPKENSTLEIDVK